MIERSPDVTISERNCAYCLIVLPLITIAQPLNYSTFMHTQTYLYEVTKRLSVVAVAYGSISLQMCANRHNFEYGSYMNE